jgi:transcriptional regulator with XRE-family HTH domain
VQGAGNAYHKRLAALRKQMKMTQRAMAERIGVTRSAYQKWEYGQRWPRPTHMDAIAVIRKEAASR